MNATDIKIMDMFFIQGKSVEEIAKELNLSETTVKAVLTALNEEDLE